MDTFDLRDKKKFKLTLSLIKIYDPDLNNI